MKHLSFKEFCAICANKRVVHEKSGLRADYDFEAAELTARINKLTGLNSYYKSDFTVYVGGDNNKEAFELNPDTPGFYWLDEKENRILAEVNREEIWFSVEEWPN